MADDNHAPAAEWRIVGETRPKPVSLLYKLGLAAVALVMVLLPIIYVGIVVLVTWGVYEHALHPRYQLGGGILALLGYLAPITCNRKKPIGSRHCLRQLRLPVSPATSFQKGEFGAFCALRRSNSSAGMYPFRHARGNVLLSDFLCEWQEANEQIGAIFNRGRCVFVRSLNLDYRVLARLACLIEHAKSSSAASREKVETGEQGEVPVQS
jgi:hypothetical protein